MEAIRYENSEIDERIIRAVTEIGYEEMTPIQQSAIPALLEGRDIIGQAPVSYTHLTLPTTPYV